MRVPPALRKEVLERVTPTAQRTRQARATARRLSKAIADEAKRRGLDVRPHLVGSLAKDTHLADPLDVDLFLLFDPKTPRKQLEDDGLALGRKVVPEPVLRYAEHPYVHGVVDGFTVDIVPAYRLRHAHERMSAVDRTPFHTEYVRRHLGPRQRPEIRLLKRFLRGIGAYGAETAVGGVSGYLAELLLLRYGTFTRAIDAMATWRAPVHLSLSGPDQPMTGPLVFIDPVDPFRNAAAAVTEATFSRLVQAAKAFRRQPSIDFFYPPAPRPVTDARLRKLLESEAPIGILVPPFEGRPETFIPQAQRLISKAARQLEKQGLALRHAQAIPGPDSWVLLLSTKPTSLDPLERHRGPQVDDKENVERFLQRWQRDPRAAGKPVVEKGRYWIDVRRAARTPRQLLEPQLARLLEGLPSTAKTPPQILEGDQLLEQPWRAGVSDFLRRRPPWRA